MWSLFFNWFYILSSLCVSTFFVFPMSFRNVWFVALYGVLCIFLLTVAPCCVACLHMLLHVIAFIVRRSAVEGAICSAPVTWLKLCCACLFGAVYVMLVIKSPVILFVIGHTTPPGWRVPNMAVLYFNSIFCTASRWILLPHMLSTFFVQTFCYEVTFTFIANTVCVPVFCLYNSVL